jgi:uncharacterized membrane protein
MIQMGASPNYQGFLVIGDRWSAAILIKHLVFFSMAGVSAYLTWGLLPRLRRAAMRRAEGEGVDDLQRQETRLLRVNLALGVIVLALTAVARAA